MINEPGLKILTRAHLHSQREALVDKAGSYTYRALLEAADDVASTLLAEKDDLHEARVAFLIPPSFEYVAILWGIWRAGGIAVPLCLTHPAPELEYVVTDADAEIVIAHPEHLDKLASVGKKHGKRFISSADLYNHQTASNFPQVNRDRRAMILYTSGTTGKPKGVVTTHANICAQITTLIDFWEWRETDRTLGVLPLHHVHGIINILSCALWSGGCCELLDIFDEDKIWTLFIEKDYSLFMAVPTVYVKLIDAWEKAAPERQIKMSEACKKMRLMVSGSAALPVNIFNKWKSITGHTFLERYGMTEIGMGISNPLNGERKPGYVGVPLPGVAVRLVDDNGTVIQSDGIPGEIQIKGENVFKEYWRRRQETQKAFLDGWFLTGDTAVVEDGYYRILGRNSVDIIKTGGYKVSALEIEETLRTHPDIKECAIVGIADEMWGERVAAAVVLKGDKVMNLTELRTWAKSRIASYKVPKELLLVEDLPRNAMGKVTKPEVKNLFSERKADPTSTKYPDNNNG
jgi:malonyl-CoA/methylmalonyl-CoA synthetase